MTPMPSQIPTLGHRDPQGGAHADHQPLGGGDPEQVRRPVVGVHDEASVNSHRHDIQSPHQQKGRAHIT